MLSEVEKPAELVKSMATVSVTVPVEMLVEEETVSVVGKVAFMVFSEPDLELELGLELELPELTVYTVVPATRVSVVVSVVFSPAGQLVTVAGHL